MGHLPPPGYHRSVTRQKPVKRHLLNLQTALSLLLCVVVAGLWVRSYWRSDQVIAGRRVPEEGYDLATRSAQFYSGRGGLMLVSWTIRWRRDVSSVQTWERARDDCAPHPRGDRAPRHRAHEHGEDPVRIAEERPSDRPPLGLVGLEELRVGRTRRDERQLPSEVPRVLNPGVHALCAHGAVNVGSVAREEYRSRAVPGGLAVVQPEMREPDRVAQVHAGVSRGIYHHLQRGR